ncbi:MAG TPA: amidohydrolase family protein [Povalibacter sp.]|uniref:amidohydrolase family protein n=1 Tax=Povalibacter sp. TaxID=1962978 RepID=UPI002CC66D0A|nr:amidohydrolase family protein [Povalibacter sp.]HMN43025.1 amidohydrolase family protein [Povalibacter sp.]
MNRINKTNRSGGFFVLAMAVAVVVAFLWTPAHATPSTGKLALVGAIVVDVNTGILIRGQNILIDDGRIVSISAGAPPPGTRIVYAFGKYVVPGYNDMHAHALDSYPNPSGALALMLANGVTGFRQMSGSDAFLQQRRDGQLPIGPDAPALLAMPGDFLTPLNAAIAEMALPVMQAQQAAGADFIKVGLVSRDVLFAVIDEGKRLNIPVAGHVPPTVDVVAAAQRGMTSIEHIGPSDGLLVACSSQRDALRAELDALPPFGSLPVNPPERILVNPAIETTPDETRRRQIIVTTFDEARCRAAARQFVAAGNWQVPTLIRLKTAQLADSLEFSTDPNLIYMPPDVVALWFSVTRDFVNQVPREARMLLRQDYALSLRAVKLLDEEGVKLLAGSDVSGGWEVPGFSLHQEFEELARAGLSPLRILQMTTRDAAEFLGRSATMGSVAPGRNADLVLLDANPTVSVANLSRIAGVVRAGRYYSAAELALLKLRVAAGRGYLQ